MADTQGSRSMIGVTGISKSRHVEHPVKQNFQWNHPGGLRPIQPICHIRFPATMCSNEPWLAGKSRKVGFDPIEKFTSQTFQYTVSHPSLATTIEHDHDKAKNLSAAPSVAAIAPAIRSEVVNRIVGAVVPNARNPPKSSRGVVDLVTKNVSQRRVIGNYPRTIVISNLPAPAIRNTSFTDIRDTIEHTKTADCSSVTSSHEDVPLDYSMKTLSKLEQEPAISTKRNLPDDIVERHILLSPGLQSVAQNDRFSPPNDGLAISNPKYNATTSHYGERNSIPDTTNLDTLCEVALSSPRTLARRHALNTKYTSTKPESLHRGNITDLLQVADQAVSDVPELQSFENHLPHKTVSVENESCEPIQQEANNCVPSSEKSESDADKSTLNNVNKVTDDQVECDKPDREVAAAIKTEFDEIPFLPRFSCHSPIDLNEACRDEYDNLYADIDSVSEGKKSHANSSSRKSPRKLDSRASRTAQRAKQSEGRDSSNESATFGGKVADFSSSKQEIHDESPNKRKFFKLGYRVHSECGDISRVKRRRLVRKRDRPASDILKSKPFANKLDAHSDNDSSAEEDGEFFKTDTAKKQVKNTYKEKSKECLKWIATAKNTIDTTTTSGAYLTDDGKFKSLLVKERFRSPNAPNVLRNDFAPPLWPKPAAPALILSPPNKKPLSSNRRFLAASVKQEKQPFDDLNESDTLDKDTIRLKSFVHEPGSDDRSAQQTMSNSRQDDDMIEMSFDEDTDEENSISLPKLADDLPIPETTSPSKSLSEEIKSRTVVVCLGRVQVLERNSDCLGDPDAKDNVTRDETHENAAPKNARIRGCWKGLEFVDECSRTPTYFQKPAEKEKMWTIVELAWKKLLDIGLINETEPDKRLTDFRGMNRTQKDLIAAKRCSVVLQRLPE